MWHSSRLTLLLALPALLAIAVLGARAASQGAAAPALVKTAPAHILVDAKGMTLYVFSADKNGTSACYNTAKFQCATLWPPLLVPAGTKAPASMPGVMGKFGEIMRTDGTHQLTYDKAPLYTFASDKKPGDMKGQGLGGVWWAVVVPTGM